MSKKNIFLIVSTFVATMIGAGFASGQEILSYFVIYGRRSVYGLFGVCVIFALCSMCVMLRVYISGLESFDSYIKFVSGKNTSRFIRTCVTLFMFVSFCSMSAGTGELVHETLNIDRNIGIFVMLGVCGVIFLFDIKGILIVNSFLAPILSLALLVLGIYTFVFRDTVVFAGGILFRICNSSFISSIIYASYNMLTAIVILCEMKHLANSKKICIYSAFLGGAAVFVIALAIWAPLSLYYGKISLGTMPFLSIVSRSGNGMKNIYSGALFASMLTTALSSGYGVIKQTEKKIKKRTVSITVLIMACLPVVMLGFEGIVKNVYSLFGYLGLVLLVIILCDGIKMIGKSK